MEGINQEQMITNCHRDIQENQYTNKYVSES